LESEMEVNVPLTTNRSKNRPATPAVYARKGIRKIHSIEDVRD